VKNKKITRKISQGVYVLTTSSGGCVVDAVSQVSAGDNPYISVAVMKSNYTCELVKKNKKFALSVLGRDVSGNIIDTFGLKSGRDIDKFQNVDLLREDDLPVLKDSLGYMICEVIDQIDTGSHILYIGKLVEADVFKDTEVLTYQYYQEHKDEYIRFETMKGKIAWVCTMCGYVYYGEILPDDFICSRCGVGKEYFEKREDA